MFQSLGRIEQQVNEDLGQLGCVPEDVGYAGEGPDQLCAMLQLAPGQRHGCLERLFQVDRSHAIRIAPGKGRHAANDGRDSLRTGRGLSQQQGQVIQNVTQVRSGQARFERVGNLDVWLAGYA